MNFRKAILFGIGLTMVAALMACNNSSNSTNSSTTITANAGYTASATVGGSFGTFAVTVMQNGSPASGAAVTFTSPSAADGTFAGGTNNGTTFAATTGANGVATSAAFTAGTLAGAYTVTATVSGASTPASFGLTNTAGTAATLAISAPSSGSESAAVSTAFGALAVLVTDSDNNPVSSASVTFTVTPGAGGASAAFSGATPLTDTEMTGSNGIATTSQTLTANSTTGAFTVVVSSGSLTPVTFNLTNTVATSVLGAGNYVFYLGGTDSGSGDCANTSGETCSSPYFTSGTIQVASNGTIMGGELSFSDFNYYVQDGVTGGMVSASSAAASGDTNLTITINTGDVNIGPGGSTAAGSGTLVLDVAMVSASKGLATEYDSWASSNGELNLQSTTLAAPSSGYTFVLSGVDGGGITDPLAIGGVVNVDGANTISGTGSVFDVDDIGSLTTDQLFTASSVSSPDQYGYVTFTLNTSALPSPGIILDGYMIDASHIRLVEQWLNDNLNATIAGTALGQTGTGTFSSSSISGSTYVISTAGGDPAGVLQAAGLLTFNSNGTMSGNISFNDLGAQSPQGGTTVTGGTYTIDASGTGNDGGTGRVTVTGLTDGGATFSYNLELYLTGDGHATVISLDGGDVLAGLSWQQGLGTLNDSSLSGLYSMTLGQVDVVGTSEAEADAIGTFTATGIADSLSGYLDQNGSLVGGSVQADQTISATYAATSTNGVLNINPTGGGGSLLTGYLIDGTQGVIIENDNQALTLGYFANQ